jgi:hypothetical protein
MTGLYGHKFLWNKESLNHSILNIPPLVHIKIAAFIYNNIILIIYEQ